MNNIAQSKEHKKELRKKYLSIRNSISPDELKKISGKIISRLLKTEEYKSCSSVFTYVNASSEIITTELIQRALEDGKTVAVPVIGKNPHEMLFVKITNLSQLIPNKYNILEPPLKKENIIAADRQTLVIVPGLVFDRDKYRTGYGGGYYDKFISENTVLANVAPAMDFQIIDSVPREGFDKPLDKIITESGIF